LRRGGPRIQAGDLVIGRDPQNGLITSTTLGCVADAWTHNSYGDCTYAYTANGELSAKTCGSEVTTYQYDDFGNLTHATMPDGITIDYVIDARNRRIGKKATAPPCRASSTATSSTPSPSWTAAAT